MNKTIQVKHVPDDEVYLALEATRGYHSPGLSVLWDIQKAMKKWPPKVVQAKLRNMVRKRKLGGCACGCRGDFSRRYP